MPGRIRNLLRRVGIEAHRYSIYRSAGAHLDLLPIHSRIDLMLDVGAYGGRYASWLCEHGHARRIVSFEPLAAAHASLVNAARGSGSEMVAATAAIPNQAKRWA